MCIATAMHWPANADAMHGCMHSCLCSQHSFAGRRQLLVTIHRRHAVLDRVVRHGAHCKRHFSCCSHWFSRRASTKWCLDNTARGRAAKKKKGGGAGQKGGGGGGASSNGPIKPSGKVKEGCEPGTAACSDNPFKPLDTDGECRCRRAAYKEETRSIILSLDKVSKTAPNGKQILNKVGLGMYLGAKIGILGVNGVARSNQTSPLDLPASVCSIAA